MNVFNGLVPTPPLAPAVAPVVTRHGALPAEPHGALAVLELTGWCAALLVAVNGALGLLGLALSPVRPDLASLGLTLAVVSWVAVVPVLVVGWPLGLLTAWLLAREPREARHVLAFAVVGAVAAVLLGLVGVTSTPDSVMLLLLAAEGALGAGGGRWLLGRSRRARAARRLTREPAGASEVTA